MGHDAHLDLGVVGTHERCVSLTHDESFPDTSTFLGAHGNVLKVGIGTRQSTGGSNRLLIGGVDSSVVGNGLEQPVNGLPHADRLTVGQQMCKEGVLGLLEQPLQGSGVSGVTGLGPARLGHVETVEEDGLQLLRRAEIHLLPRCLPGQLLGLANPGIEVSTQPVQHVGVDGNTSLFHGDQTALNRQLKIVEQAELATIVEFPLEDVGQPSDEYRSTRRQFSRGIVVTEVECALTGLIVGRDKFKIEILKNQIVKLILAPIRVQQVGSQLGVTAETVNSHPTCGESFDLALGGMHDLGAVGVSEPIGEGLLISWAEISEVQPDGFLLR